MQKIKAPLPPSKSKNSSSTAAPAPKAPVVKKSFSAPMPWDGSTDGEKIILYADSGMGKTTLSSMAPKPVFIGLDDGGRKIVHPITGEHLMAFPGVETFADVRCVLQQPDLFKGYETVVIDTATLLEELAIDYVLENIPNEKGVKMSDIVKYGYNKGYRHLYDTMKLILQDCDGLVKTGINVILIAQSAPIKVANSAGDDYLRDGPRLTANRDANVEALYCEWADHVLKIGYNALQVKEKKVSASDQRVIFVHGASYFRAKSRTIGTEYPVISFDSKTDDSIWQFLFGENNE